MTSNDQYLDQLLSLPKLYGSATSPDGRWVAWVWAGIGATMDVYAVPTDASAEPICLTQGYQGQDSWLVSWMPNSKAVVVAQDHDGDERARLFWIELTQPGLMQPLTEESPQYFLRGGQVHPNGRWLVYAANYDAVTQQEIEPSYLYRHDLQTGERVALARPQKACYYAPVLNAQGTHILYNRKDLHPAGYQLWMVDIDGKEDREILNVGEDMKVTGSWLADGRRVLVMAETQTHSRVGVWDGMASGVRWMIDNPSRNIDNAFVPYGCDQAVVVEIKDARVKASLLDVETGKETYLPELPGNLLPTAPISSGEWAGEFYSSQQPRDVVRFSVANPQPESFISLTRVWEKTSLRPVDLVAAEDFRWTSVDGLPIQGWLYRPRGEAMGTIVYVHGGPTWHSENNLNYQIQYFVSQGFNVLDPNYRGSTGFSRAFQEAIKEDGWGGREQEDIRTGIEALIAAGIAEPGKVGITGTSYGGYSSWCAITRFAPEILAASAPICGMTDLVVDYQTTRPDLRPYSEEMIGGSPNQVPERYYKASPINFVSNIKGRLLIVQGLQDPNVTPSNVEVVKEKLDQSEIEYQLLAFDDEGHGIGRPKNQKMLCLRLAEFFREAFELSK